ncbi:hypothetical protein [uncultured Parvimonas sp.]|uniref:hypothetical protein n=1 Tax=uncultured Parvimonas sp. TaxID=747372 RepID=UPI002593ADE4|nr:hypothetical protein [uncultured Parvimonas sp.]
MELNKIIEELEYNSSLIKNSSIILTLVLDYLETDTDTTNPLSCWDLIVKKKFSGLIINIQDTLRDISKKQYYLINNLYQVKKHNKI